MNLIDLFLVVGSMFDLFLDVFSINFALFVRHPFYVDSDGFCMDVSELFDGILFKRTLGDSYSIA